MPMATRVGAAKLSEDVADAALSEAEDAPELASEELSLAVDSGEDSLAVSEAVPELSVAVVVVDAVPLAAEVPLAMVSLPQKVAAKARVAWTSASLQPPGAVMHCCTPDRKPWLPQMQALSVTAQPVEEILFSAQVVAQAGRSLRL